MEGDDGATTGVFHHIGQNLWATKFLAIVAGDDVPHHDLIVVAQHDILLPAHPAMRRTEQAGVEHFVGKVGIFQVAGTGVATATDVVVGMVANAVPVIDDHLEDFRVLAHVVAHHEEGGLDAFALEQAQYPGGDQGDRAVIEGEIDGFLLGIDAPQRLRIEAAEQVGYLLYEHR